MPQQPAVTLTDDERTTLETFVHRGKANARTLTRAHPAQISRRVEHLSPGRCFRCVRRQSRMCEGGSPKGDWKPSCTIKCNNIVAEPFMTDRLPT